MKHTKYFSLIGVFALSLGVAATVVAQESEDAMDEFMTTPADESAAKSAPNAPAVNGREPSPGGVIDMRGAAAPVAASQPQPNPEVDKLEAMMIAEAEMKVFMKAGGLRSRKIK